MSDLMARLRDEAKALRAKEWQPPFGAVADRVCEYFDEAADALEAAERQLRETETLLQDRIRTLTSQNPDSAKPTMYVTECSASWCGKPIAPADLYEIGVSERGRRSGTVPFHKACYAQIGQQNRTKGDHA